MGSYVTTEDNRLARDIESKGLVATNVGDLRKHRSMRSASSRMIQQQQTSDVHFRQMDARLDRCESILQELVLHISQLVSRPMVSDRVQE